MLMDAPRRLHWVQVRDALETPEAWVRGRVIGAAGIEVDFEFDRDAHAGDGNSRQTVTCPRLDRFPNLLTEAVPHEQGGILAFLTVAGGVLAVPEASWCADGGAGIEITNSVVIVEDRRYFELVASDGNWRVRLLEARLGTSAPAGPR